LRYLLKKELNTPVSHLSHFHRLTLSVGLCSIVTFFNLYWLQPLLPLLQQDFGVSTLSANLAMAAPMSGMGIGLLIFASWSDAIGRRKIMLWGTSVAVMITVFLPLIDNYSVFLGVRFFQGILLAVCPAVAVPLLGDELRKYCLPGAVGVYVAANSLGGIGGRMLSGISAEYGGHWQVAGFAISGVSIVLLAVVFVCLPHQRRFKPTPFRLGNCLRSYAGHLRRPELVLTYVMVGLVFGSFMNQFSFLMLTLSKAPYELPSDIRSLLFIAFIGGTVSASMAGKFAKKHGQLAGIATGVCVMLGANVFLQTGILPLMVLGLMGTAIGFFFCHAQASTLVGRSVISGKGSAMALYSLFYYTGASLGAFYLEPFYQNWGWSGVVAGTTIALTTCLVLVGISWRWFAPSRTPRIVTA
jgi:YNFM family putative membrane transporter